MRVYILSFFLSILFFRFSSYTKHITELPDIIYRKYHIYFHIEASIHHLILNDLFILKRCYKRRSRKIIKSLHGKAEQFLLKYYLKIKFLKNFAKFSENLYGKNGFLEISKNLTIIHI